MVFPLPFLFVRFPPFTALGALMGVPKFFRWIAERYPCVITPFKDSPPPIDNLYLDMNGIIHQCTHPNDIDATRRAPTEKEMVQAMFAYLEKLFNAIQPRKMFYMAIDGCAPRAKMNQQRQRRYRAGYEMMVAREEALKMGEEVPDEADMFDSNCITPGTEFMTRVSEQFQYYITMKQMSDSAWQNCKVIFSGHNDPGEGEHKIVDLIRRRKMLPNYDPNESHCMYGLDADLIMLALATHEPHFVLLREVVTFGGAGSKKEQMKRAEDEAKGIKEDPKLVRPDSFVLFHVGLLREFLEMELRGGEINGTLEPIANFNLEQCIDDFVFMCVFVGNDFLPALPTLGIGDGSITTMLQLYRELVLSRGDYLLKDRVINWNAVERLLARIGEMELDTLRARQEEEREYLKREQRKSGGHEAPVSLAPISSMAEFKQRFYTDKHRFRDGWAPRGQDLALLRQHYVEGLEWVAQYYYQGPPSWKWFYPHHYAPLASDLVNLAAVGGSVRFELGQPFLPHQQLLAVLPPMSYRSMPKAYHGLLRSSNSPLVEYFPQHLEIDREAARAPWEGIVLIPFMDERKLLAAYDSVQHLVSAEDKARNQQGKPIYFQFAHDTIPYTLSNAMFGDLQQVRVRRINFEMPPHVHFVPALCNNVRVGKQHLEGFASFYQRQEMTTVKYELGAVNIFGMPSRRESLLLVVDDRSDRVAETAEDVTFLVGQPVWINFPHWKRARVSSIIDRRKRLRARWDKDGNYQGFEAADLSTEEYRTFKKDVQTHTEYLKAKLGIVLPNIDVFVYVNRFIGMRATRKGRLMHQYSTRETMYPLQLVEAMNKLDIQPDARNVERDRDANDFGDGQQIIFIGGDPKTNKGEPLLGSTGFVTERVAESDLCNVILRHFTVPQEVPSGLADWSDKDNWMSLGEVCDLIRKRLRMQVSTATLSQFCSSISTSPQFGSTELGLCLKFTGKNLARIGYAKLVQTQQNPWYVGASNVFESLNDDLPPSSADSGRPHGPAGGGSAGVNASGRGTWYLSLQASDLILEYADKFRPILERLERGGGNSAQFDMAGAMTGPWQDREVGSVIAEITGWLAAKKIHDQPMSQASDDTVSDGLITELEQMLEGSPRPRPTEELRLKRIAARHMYFPTCRLPEGFVVAVPLPLKDQPFSLGKRVVYCRTTGSVPFGSTGTITRLIGDGVTAEVVFDDIFVAGTRLGGRLKTQRGALCKLQSLIVLSPSNAVAADGAQGPQSVGSPLAMTNAAAAAAMTASVTRTPTAVPAAIKPKPKTSTTGITVADTTGAGISLLEVERQMRHKEHTPASTTVNQPTPGSAPVLPVPRSAQHQQQQQQASSGSAAPPRASPSATELLSRLTVAGPVRTAPSDAPQQPAATRAAGAGSVPTAIVARPAASSSPSSSNASATRALTPAELFAKTMSDLMMAKFNVKV